MKSLSNAEWEYYNCANQEVSDQRIAELKRSTRLNLIEKAISFNGLIEDDSTVMNCKLVDSSSHHVTFHLTIQRPEVPEQQQQQQQQPVLPTFDHEQHALPNSNEMEVTSSNEHQKEEEEEQGDSTSRSEEETEAKDDSKKRKKSADKSKSFIPLFSKRSSIFFFVEYSSYFCCTA